LKETEGIIKEIIVYQLLAKNSFLFPLETSKAYALRYPEQKLQSNHIFSTRLQFAAKKFQFLSNVQIHIYLYNFMVIRF